MRMLFMFRLHDSKHQAYRIRALCGAEQPFLKCLQTNILSEHLCMCVTKQSVQCRTDDLEAVLSEI